MCFSAPFPLHTFIYSSSIVQKCLVDAHDAGKDFRVIVVDSRPKMEGWQMNTNCNHQDVGCNNYCAAIASPLVGRECLRKLVKSGIKCSYVLVNAVSYIMKEVGKKITNPGLSHDSLFMSLGLQGDHRSSCLIGQWLCHVSYRHCPDSPGGQVLQCPSARLL